MYSATPRPQRSVAQASVCRVSALEGHRMCLRKRELCMGQVCFRTSRDVWTARGMFKFGSYLVSLEKNQVSAYD